MTFHDTRVCVLACHCWLVSLYQGVNADKESGSLYVDTQTWYDLTHEKFIPPS